MRIFGTILPFIGFSDEDYESLEEMPERIREGLGMDDAIAAIKEADPSYELIAINTRFFELSWFDYALRYVLGVKVHYRGDRRINEQL